MNDLKYNINAIKQCSNEIDFNNSSKDKSNSSNPLNQESYLELSISFQKDTYNQNNNNLDKSNIDKSNLDKSNLDKSTTIKYNTILNNFKKKIEAEMEDIDDISIGLNQLMVTTSFMNPELKIVTVEELIHSFMYAHYKSAEDTKTNLIIKVSEGLPCSLDIMKISVKMIINNFISNSIKKTSQGSVIVNFKKYKPSDMIFFKYFYLSGANLIEAEYYVCISVIDDGEGIAPEDLNELFINPNGFANFTNEKSEYGHYFCNMLAKSIGASIIYNSLQNMVTCFTLCIPMSNQEEYANSQQKPGYEIYKNPIDIIHEFQPSPRKFKHICNSLVLAMNGSEKESVDAQILTKMNIPFQYFTSGEECIRYLNYELFNSCKNCPLVLILMSEELADIRGDELAYCIKILDVDSKVRMDFVGTISPEGLAAGYYESQCERMNDMILKEYYIWLKKENEDYVNRKELKMLGLLIEGDEDASQSKESDNVKYPFRPKYQDNPLPKAKVRYNQPNNTVFKDNNKRVIKDYL